jgi:aminoglycoside 6'-N-acetyltransferase
MGPITLERVVWELHGALLTGWLGRPHVSRWWGDAETRGDQMRRTPDAEHAIIAVDGRPVGYLRWKRVGRGALDRAGLSEIPEGAIDIDIFLGEPEWLGRGVGSTVLRILLEQRLRREADAPLAGLCTSVENVAAIRAFEKAGFRKLREFEDPIYGRCWLLVADLRGAREGAE